MGWGQDGGRGREDTSGHSRPFLLKPFVTNLPEDKRERELTSAYSIPGSVSVHAQFSLLETLFS